MLDHRSTGSPRGSTWTTRAAPLAARNRITKAHRIADWAASNRFTSEHVEHADPAQWARLCRSAGEQRAASEKTQRLVIAYLIVKEAWAEAYPDTSRAKDPAAALTTGARA